MWAVARSFEVQLGKAGSGSLILAKRARKRLAPFRRKSQERSLSCKKWSARCTSKTWHPFEDDPTEELGKQDRSKMASKHSKILAELRRSKECFRTFTPQEPRQWIPLQSLKLTLELQQLDFPQTAAAILLVDFVKETGLRLV